MNRPRPKPTPLEIAGRISLTIRLLAAYLAEKLEEPVFNDFIKIGLHLGGNTVMPKTMNKEDVVYRAKLAVFDINAIKELSGRSPSSAVKVAIKEMSREKKSGALKDPELKIGKIGPHLYLRAKDKKTHLDDFLLAKNWTAPPDPDEAPVRDNAYRRKVADYIEIRKGALEEITMGEKEIKSWLAELQENLAFVQDLIPEAKAGFFGTNNPGDKATEKMHISIEIARTAKNLFDKNVHPPFQEHRNYKMPDGVDIADVDEYGRSFYLTQMRPKYGKAVEYVKLCNTTVAQIRAAAKNVRNFADHRDEEEANYRSMAGELVSLAENEVEAATQVWGLQPVEEVARAVGDDADKIIGLRAQVEDEGLDPGTAEQLTQRYLSTATERMVTMRNGYSRLKKHIQQMDGIVSRVKTIPKPMQKDRTVKDHIGNIAAAQKQLRTYVKAVDGHIKAAATAFTRVKKEAAEA